MDVMTFLSASIVTPSCEMGALFPTNLSGLGVFMPEGGGEQVIISLVVEDVQKSGHVF